MGAALLLTQPCHGDSGLRKELWAFQPTHLLRVGLEKSQNKVSFQEAHIVQHRPTETGRIEKFCSSGRESPTRTRLAAAAASPLPHRASIGTAAVPEAASQQRSSFCFKKRLFCIKGRGRVSAAGVRGFGDKAGDTSKLVSTNTRISNLLLLKTKSGILA